MFMRRLIAGLVLSLLGSALFTFWLSTKLKGKQEVKLHYMAPLMNLDAGASIGREQLKAIDWPAGAPLTGAFTKPEDLVGRTLLYPISADEPILDRALAASGAGAGLVAHIPDGLRAISLRSDAITGVAGYLLPGTHIDVLVTYRIVNPATGAQGPMATFTVLQDVPILTAGQQMQPDPTGKAVTTDVVTLLVDPEEAEKATIAAAQGSTHFVLRNGTDHSRIAAQPLQMVPLGEGTMLPQGTWQGEHAAAAEQRQLGPMNHVPPQGSPTAAQSSAARHAEPGPVVKAYQVQTINGNKQSVETF